jgi:hypothetical protein
VTSDHKVALPILQFFFFFHKNRILIQRFLMTNGKEANLHNSALISN